MAPKMEAVADGGKRAQEEKPMTAGSSKREFMVMEGLCLILAKVFKSTSHKSFAEKWGKVVSPAYCRFFEIAGYSPYGQTTAGTLESAVGIWPKSDNTRD
jgi:hypothetical protein